MAVGLASAGVGTYFQAAKFAAHAKTITICSGGVISSVSKATTNCIEGKPVQEGLITAAVCGAASAGAGQCAGKLLDKIERFKIVMEKGSDIEKVRA